MNEKLEKMKNEMRGKCAALIGFGVSNRAAARFLISVGMTVTAYDAKSSDEAISLAREMGIDLIECGEFDGIDADIVLRSPGVRPDAIGISRGEMTSEMELFVSLCPCPICAVTGSDGKTTTTTLISKMLEAEFHGTGRRVWLGGNIGTPLLPEIGKIGECDVCVLELSSFQLMTMNFSPRVAVVTNVSPNHLNWHLSMDEYVASKRRIFENQTADCRLVVNVENAITAGFAADARGEVLTFSSKKSADATIANGAIYIGGRRIIPISEIIIPGVHNAENMMAAMLAVSGVVSDENMRKVARTFRGVPHRAELVLERGGVRFYNSSIDTSPTRTVAALSAFDKKVIVIIGGYDKHIPPEPLILPLKEKTKMIFCTGDTGRAIFDMMTGAGYAGDITYTEDFDEAVTRAAESAESGDTVILSPAAASFDRFKNFEERGERFVQILKNINM